MSNEATCSRRRPCATAPALLLAALLMLASCANPERWKFREEVVLNNGELVLVDRIALRNNVWPNMGGGGYRSVVNQWISQPRLRVEYEERKYSFRPFSMGYVNGDLFIAARGEADVEFCKRNPKAFVVALWKHSLGEWHEVPQSDDLLDSLTFNLLMDLEWGEPSEPKPTYLSLAEKSKRQGIDFSNPPNLRTFLEKDQGSRCIDVLRRWGWATPEVPASVRSESR